MTKQAIRLGLVLAVAGPFAACGVFDREEPLEGERIPVRELLDRQNVPPADPLPPEAAPEAVATQ